MKKIIKIAIITLSVLFTTKLFAQSSLYVSTGANFFITSGTTVSIDSLLIKPSADFNISGENSVTRDALATPAPSNSYIQRVYHFFQTTSPFSGDITVYYRDSELNGLAENTLDLSIYNGTVWTAYPASQRDGVNNFVTRLGLAAVNLNEVTLTAPGGVVPITLSRFIGQSINCTGLLSWNTASEQNSKHFELLQSTDGINFNVIKIIPASGISNTDKDYNYTANLQNKDNYFRLRMVDLDGQSKLSDVVNLTGDCNKNIIAVFPNPTKNSITISGLNGKNQLRLIDQLGQVISVMTTSNSSETINLFRVASGSYIMQVVQNDKLIKSIKIIKD